MKKSLFKIIFSLLLVFAVSDYIWYELIQDESVSFELETEKKEELKEEIREGERSLDGKHLSHDGPWFLNVNSQFILKHSIFDNLNVFHNTPNISQPLKLFIYHCQLRLHC